MASWGLLDERSESDLHKSRLLNVEEKPFKRITKRLTSISSAINGLSTATSSNDQAASNSTRELQEDLTFDFAAFDSNIARLQFLHDANERERQRYETDKKRILEECQTVRDKNADLREHLDGALATLSQRKKFDELAEKITLNRLLRPREDQLLSLAKLEEECKELERESETYSVTWRERREQFNRIMEEGMMLRRQIRDEKEEVDRREGMNEDADEDGEPDRAAPTPRNEQSGGATPRPDSDKPDDSKDNEDGEPDRLSVPSASRSRNNSHAGSREASPAGLKNGDNDEDESDEGEADEEQEADDVEMTDEVTTHPATEKMEVDE
ncbi:Putative Tho complex subunit 7 [[Torrubiella] hemipterigena]|uniref:Putative Tho complex subunit 7 n=1 Tax=[Torrubiella] hemipterigena TaxID=1531966 RepID=A0A0A1TKS0_9HYPO|nr:Putative Tho complex subunit 7 [[Torrubiella] hemipterigena]